MDLNLFVVFEAVFSAGGVTRASEHLHLTQSAISHALARLRQIFSDPLFVRRGRSLAPTPLARKMIEPVRRAIREFEFGIVRIDSFDPARTRRRFVIGMRDPYEAPILPELLRAVCRTCPFIDLSVVRVVREDLVRELASGAIDVAVDIRLPLTDEIRRVSFMPGKFVVLARRGHPKVRRTLDLKTYLAQEHIVVTSRRRGQSAEEFELGRTNLRRRVRVRCQTNFAACRIVSQTDLLLTIPERYARTTNAIFRNQILPFPLKAPTLDGLLYWHETADSDAGNAWLRNQLLAAAR
jgi:DNA-binding transcriptional LysR family regulator